MFWYKSATKPEYWQELLTVINDLAAVGLVSCDKDKCPTWFDENNHGCDFWHEDNQKHQEDELGKYQNE
ncbi:hypothetical protein [Psychromonas sp. Urea-02u-13]|uniref:hypothetical protein n=1 Tax=Psychromonas sp. Urea-02u-13 TaxID=2058326 RepID=UPI0012FF06CB|nr:hypothetical protein [Psychromonas sp. Urea-02u-13]